MPICSYHKKTEKDEEYVQTVCQLARVVETVVKQNNAIDIYEDLFNVSPRGRRDACSRGADDRMPGRTTSRARLPPGR